MKIGEKNKVIKIMIDDEYTEYETLQVVFTCGVCETICDGKDVDSHGCLEGFSKKYVDNNNYFYPVAEDDTIIRRTLMPNDKEEIVRTAKPTQSSGGGKAPKIKRSRGRPPKIRGEEFSKLTDEDIERLINEVREHPPLWDITLAPEKKGTTQSRQRMWNNVSEALNGKISAEDAKAKFKNLRDTHRNIIQREYYNSGAARREDEEQWAFYKVMEFLRDTCLIRETSGNVPRLEIGDDSDPDDINTRTPPTNPPYAPEKSRQQRSNSRKKSECEAENVQNPLHRIADAMSKDQQPLTITLPPIPALDEVDSMLQTIGLKIRRLPDRVRRKILRDTLNLVEDKVDELIDEI